MYSLFFILSLSLDVGSRRLSGYIIKVHINLPSVELDLYGIITGDLFLTAYTIIGDGINSKQFTIYRLIDIMDNGDKFGGDKLPLILQSIIIQMIKNMKTGISNLSLPHLRES